MTVTSYFNSLPYDSQYFLLDHANEPNEVKRVVGDKINDKAFMEQLIDLLNKTQSIRLNEQQQRVADNMKALDDSLARLKIAPGIIEAITGKFRHFCKKCGASIESGDLCEKCKGN